MFLPAVVIFRQSVFIKSISLQLHIMCQIAEVSIVHLMLYMLLGSLITAINCLKYDVKIVILQYLVALKLHCIRRRLFSIQWCLVYRLFGCLVVCFNPFEVGNRRVNYSNLYKFGECQVGVYIFHVLACIVRLLEETSLNHFIFVVPCIVIPGWRNPMRCSSMQIFIYC